MDNFQISSILRGDIRVRNIFKGCFMNNAVPFPKISSSDESCYVVNVISNPYVMGHWVCFYFRDNTMFFFDSFGVDPTIYSGDIKFLFNNYIGEKIIVVTNPIQSSTSNVCGGYVIWFLKMMAHKKNHLDSYKSFSV